MSLDFVTRSSHHIDHTTSASHYDAFTLFMKRCAESI